MSYKPLFIPLAMSTLFVAGAHPHHGPERAVQPASGNYQLTVPATWYDARRFDEPVQDEGDKLYLAETETMFEAWRDGRVTGPVLQVMSLPSYNSDEARGLSAEARLERALEGAPASKLESGRLGGHPALTLHGFPYRNARFAAMTAALVGDRLFYLVYAADKAEHFAEAETIAKSFVTANISSTSSDEKTPNDLVGRPAPDFKARLLRGGEVSPAELRGQTLIINFWATMCYGCQEEMRLLDQLAEGRDNVRVLSVNWRDAPGLAQKFIERYDLSLPVALNRTGLISDRYSVDVFPATVVVAPDGIVRSAPQFSSGMTFAEVESWLE